MDRYHLLFAGEVADGQDLGTVKQRMSEYLEIAPGPELDRLFDGEPHILRHDLEREELNKAFMALARLGARPVIAEVVNVETPPLPVDFGDDQPEPEPEPEPDLEREPAAVEAEDIPVPVVDDVEEQEPYPQQYHPEAIPLPEVEAETEPRVPGGAAATGSKAATAPAPRPEPDSEESAEEDGEDGEPGFEVEEAPDAHTPNLFAMRLSDRAESHPAERSTSGFETFGIYPLIIVTLAILVGYLVSTVVMVDDVPVDRGGPTALQTDFSRNLYVRVGSLVIKHDAGGRHIETFDLESWGLTGLQGDLGVFANGDFLQWGLGPEFIGLHRCSIADQSCSQLPDLPIPDGEPIPFTLDGDGAIYLVHTPANRVLKFDIGSESLIAGDTRYESPAAVVVHRGLMYVANAGESSVAVALPDNVGFGSILERRSVATDAIDNVNFDLLGRLARHGDKWWAFFHSDDHPRVVLQQYDSDWQPLVQHLLPETSAPYSMLVWGDQLLVTDEFRRTVYRYDSSGLPMDAFSSGELEDIVEIPEQVFWQPWVETVAMIIAALLLAILVMLTLISRLKKRIYIPPPDPEEVLFDVNNPAILWFGSSPAVRERIKRIGYGVVAAFLLILIAARLEFLPAVFSLLLLVLCMGLIASLVGLYQSSHCFIGVLGDKLVLVDQNDTYRVARPSRVQHRNNHLMIDDVIIFLGNRLQRIFDDDALKANVMPIVGRGIRTDRATVQVKMIEARHPQIVAQAFAAAAAALAVLYLGVW